jgi:hypothetical protein
MSPKIFALANASPRDAGVALTFNETLEKNAKASTCEEKIESDGVVNPVPKPNYA